MKFRAQQILESAGIRPTPNRVIVLNQLIDSECPLGLAELEQAIDTLDKSSIFRVLNLFLSSHIVHAVEDGRGYTKYELCHSGSDHSDDDQHPHFYCRVCQRTICLHDIEIPPFSLSDGYKLESVNFMLKGVCPDCADK